MSEHSQAPRLPLELVARSGGSLLPRGLALPLAATWLLVFAAVLMFLWPLAMLFDSDSYYHLAIARAFLQRGVIADLPWARFSAMHQGFGDKEFLFHCLLVPAAASRDPVLGAKITLAALDASVLTSVGYLAWRAAGPRALVLPALAIVGSFWFDMRVIRLRPELLALLILLWTVHALSVRRPLLAAAGACAFALSYTAFHALLGVCGVCFVTRLVIERKPSWQLLLWPMLGASVGLVLHPHFPQNLRIFWLQNFEFWRYQTSADIGNEILALGWLRWLRYDWPLFVGCAILAATLRRSERPDQATRDVGLTYCSAAVPFVLLFVHSARFVLYAVPLGLLAVLWLVRLLGWQLDERVWWRRRAGPRAWLALCLLGLIALPLTAAELEAQVEHAGCVWPALRSELTALSRVLPVGAKVAAPWDSSQDYMYFAPQARYLNVLDPLFMRSAHPAAYEAQRALFAGQQQDVPLTLQVDLDSEYLAFPARKYPVLREQLASDPRVELIQSRGQVVYRLRPERARAFVRDYRVATSRMAALQPTAARYPRHFNPAGADIEGVIIGERVASWQRSHGQCLWFAPQYGSEPERAPAQQGVGEFEFASTVAARIWVDDQLLASIAPSARLMLGAGARVQLPATSAVAIELCPAGQVAPSFYLLRREAEAASARLP